MTTEQAHTPLPESKLRELGALFNRENEARIRARLATYEAALREIVDRSNNGIPGTAKVNDMRQIALKALGDAQ